MSSTSDIQAKWQTLKTSGVDLGAPQGPQTDAGYGGCFQAYANGRIYWHPTVGVFEVQGGILTKYLAMGGTGINPLTNNRNFGFPVADEGWVVGDDRRVSYFELGAIYWVNGGRSVCGDIHTTYMQTGGSQSALGFPVSDNIKIAGGEVVYFEFGCIFKPANLPPAVFSFRAPLIGNPAFVGTGAGTALFDGGDSQHHNMEITGTIALGSTAAINAAAKQFYTNNPLLLQTIFQGKLGLREVKRAGIIRELFTLQINKPVVTVFPPVTPTPPPVPPGAIHPIPPVTIPGRISITAAITLKPTDSLLNRQLYDLCFITDSLNNFFTTSPHSVYAKTEWNDLGIVHITDSHVALRYDFIKSKLGGMEGMEDANKYFMNPNANFRAMITYVNGLYDEGKLDVIMHTGDLIDYIFENGAYQQGRGNFGILIDLLLGRILPYADNTASPAEELLVPMLTTLGNHDFRPVAYDPYVKIDVNWLVDDFAGDDLTQREYTDWNLTKDEAITLQALWGRGPSTPEDLAASFIFRDPTKLYYYNQRINRFGSYSAIGLNSYIVRLGSNRLAMMDTGPDAVTLTSITKIIEVKEFGLGSEADKRFFEGGDTAGFSDDDISVIHAELNDPAASGAFIVGIHAPAINPDGSEYNHYFRATEHITINPQLTAGYLVRYGEMTPEEFVAYNFEGNNEFNGWLLSNAPYFIKKASFLDDLDNGSPYTNLNGFWRSCLGIGLSRKVDLVLSGHIHKSTEWRLGWDSQQNAMTCYFDFYTENPGYYYSSKYTDPIFAPFFTKPTSHKVFIQVEPGAVINGTPQTFTTPGEGTWQLLTVPPNPNTLANTTNPAQWWNDHRPLITQTSCLGWVDNPQRQDIQVSQYNGFKPEPLFTGLRFIQIANNVISKMTYIKNSDFVSIIHSTVPVTPVGPVKQG